MKIEIWLDYACEKAFLVHKNLIEIIKELNLESEVLYRSYISLSNDESVDDKVNDEILNLNPNYVPSYQSNSIYAHQLSHYAKKHRLATNANVLLFNERYLHNNDLGDRNIIIKIANKLGFETEVICEIMDQKIFLDAINQNYVNAKAKKINNIPHIRLNGRVNINGYTLKSELKSIINHEAHKMVRLDHCADGACDKKSDSK